MKIHEYQAKEIFQKYGIPTPEGGVARSPVDAKKISQNIGKPVVLKAQVPVGGRGKAGGIKKANTPDEAEKLAQELLGMDIKGSVVRTLLVVEALQIQKEFYLGLVLDRSSKKITLMYSEAGGVDIEEVAQKTPEKIHKIYIDPILGVKDFQLLRVFSPFFSNKEQLKSLLSISRSLYAVFMKEDCTLAEINPLALLEDGRIVASDSKMNMDENAELRHTEWNGYKDRDFLDPLEEKAKSAGLSFVALDGEVGCVVNGAGLAMATMDAVKLYQGEPANFLDVGGSSDPQKVVTALEIITANQRVRSILFNIFGGITRCDDIAKGILTALDQIQISVPIVLRLTGTNEKEAHSMLKKLKACLNLCK